MELNIFSYAAIGVLIAGIVLLVFSSKKRGENGEWSNALQWGYLLLMIGVFGILSAGLSWSFTAVLLLFTVASGAIWIWRKATVKKNQTDHNHFRDYMAGFFPVIGIVFVLRTFIAEPFQIPSSSMRPGLIKGDFILVNKFSYGIRVPVLNNVLIDTGKVERGDVVVFNYPVQPATNYIKRIVAVGGDTVEYKDKVLTVNGNIVEQDTPDGSYTYNDDNIPDKVLEAQRFHAQFNGRQFDILQNSMAPSLSANAYIPHLTAERHADFLTHCSEYNESGFKCTVPQGQYFAMGDNRDNSADSRYWGFVDDKYMVGKAFVVWLNLQSFGRIGTVIR